MGAETPLLSVIVPCYNERATVAEILRRVREVPVSKEIIVVDDHSSDGSREIVAALAAEWPELRHIMQPANQGKGAAIRMGIAAARGEIVLIQDADLEYDPEQYPRLIQPILDGDADVVYGSRFEGYPRRVMMYWHTLGNKFLTFLSNATTNLNLTDMETCYKVFRREIIQSITLRSNRFGFEPEVTAKIARRGYRVYEVPISYHGRDYWEGKKISWRDGVSAIWTILKFGLVLNEDGEPEGYVTLERMHALRRYNNWIWDRIRPYIGSRVLEVGSGIGTMTRFLYGRDVVVASDVEPAYLDRLRNSYRRRPGMYVEKFDLDRDGIDHLTQYRFDSIMCLNVLEHIEDDRAALRKMHELLSPGGTAVLYIPANPRLFGSLDEAVGHYRRYSREEIETKLRETGFEVEFIAHQNQIGQLGWWFNACLLRRRHLPTGQGKLFDLAVPLLRRIEPENGDSGLSIIAIGRKPRTATAPVGASTQLAGATV